MHELIIPFKSVALGFGGVGLFCLFVFFLNITVFPEMKRTKKPLYRN